MPSLRRRTLAPEPVSPMPESRKRSKSMQEGEKDYTDVCCEKCGSGERPSELLLCDGCDRGFHLFCLRPVLVAVPKGRWFCPSCSNHKNLTSMLLGSWFLFIFRDFFRDHFQYVYIRSYMSISSFSHVKSKHFDYNWELEVSE